MCGPRKLSGSNAPSSLNRRLSDEKQRNRELAQEIERERSHSSVA